MPLFLFFHAMTDGYGDIFFFLSESRDILEKNKSVVFFKAETSHGTPRIGVDDCLLGGLTSITKHSLKL